MIVGELFLTLGALISALSAGVAAYATFKIANLTREMVDENKLLRQAGTEPEVIAYIIPHPKGNGGMNFVIENVGSGVAKNISFKFKCDEEDFKLHVVRVNNDATRGKISFLPTNQKISALFGVSYDLAGGNRNIGMLKPFKVIIKYQNSKNEKYTKAYKIDISSYAGLPGIFDKPSLEGMNMSLKKLADVYGKRFAPNINSMESIAVSLRKLAKFQDESFTIKRRRKKNRNLRG